MKPPVVVSASAVSAITLALSLVASAQTHPEKPTYKFEKCYAVARAGHNDCYTATHSCGNVTKKDSDPASWIYVPRGTCSKIVGGSLSPK